MKTKIKSILNNAKLYIQNQFEQVYLFRELKQSLDKKSSDLIYIDELVEKTEARLNTRKEKEVLLKTNIVKQLEYKQKITAKQELIVQELIEVKKNCWLLRLLISLKIQKDI